MSRRAARLVGQTRAQLAWSKRLKALPSGRTGLPGLHWILGSVINTVTEPSEILEKLRALWQEHGNIGALRDAFLLCGRMTEPALQMPGWLVDDLDVQLLSPDTSRRWRKYCDDMLDLHRLDLFEIAHAHGISREEAADFVVRCEKDAGRDVGAPTVLKLTNAVPRRAAINTGRYYTAASWRLENPAISRSAIQAGQAALNARSGGRRLFVSRLLSE